MVFTSVGVSPLTNTALVEDDAPARSVRAEVRSPKLVASPVVAIVTNSMVLVREAPSPPPIIPRVLLELLPIYILILVKLPKSIAFPVDEIVMKSIVSEYVRYI